MLQAIPRDVFFLVGLGVIILVGIVIVEFVKNWADKISKKTLFTHRRKQDENWPSVLIEVLNNNGKELRDIRTDIGDIRLALRNGLTNKLNDVVETMQKCHELNVIKEHDIRMDRQD